MIKTTEAWHFERAAVDIGEDASSLVGEGPELSGSCSEIEA